MTEGSSLPKTDNIDIMRAAIAFEIAKIAMSKQLYVTTQPEAHAQKFTAIYVEALKTITGSDDEKK